MATIKEEIMSIAEAQGYEGDGGSTIAEAVNALGSVMGGGGSGGGGNLVKVTISPNGTGPLIADKTNKEIYDLYHEGALIYFKIVGDHANDYWTYTGGTITTSYDVYMLTSNEGGPANYKVNVYYLSANDNGMGNWGLQAFKLMSESGNEYNPYPLQLS